MSMKLVLKRLAAALFLTAAAAAGAQDLTRAEELLRRADRALSFLPYDLSAEYAIERRDPGGAAQTSVLTVFRRDRAGQFLALQLEPALERGKGYLKQGDILWLWDPVGRAFAFTSAAERFSDSGLRSADLGRAGYADDYVVAGVRRESLGKFMCTVLELRARHDRVLFPGARLWISDGDDLVRKAEDYSLSGQLMRTTAVPSYQSVRDRWLPATMVIVDHLKSRVVNGVTTFERTTVTISKPSLEALPDALFTKDYLERVRTRP